MDLELWNPAYLRKYGQAFQSKLLQRPQHPKTKISQVQYCFLYPTYTNSIVQPLPTVFDNPPLPTESPEAPRLPQGLKNNMDTLRRVRALGQFLFSSSSRTIYIIIYCIYHKNTEIFFFFFLIHINPSVDPSVSWYSTLLKIKQN